MSFESGAPRQDRTVGLLLRRQCANPRFEPGTLVDIGSILSIALVPIVHLRPRFVVASEGKLKAVGPADVCASRDRDRTRRCDMLNIAEVQKTVFMAQGHEFKTRDAAQAHINAVQAQTRIERAHNATEFTVTPEHLALFRHLVFRWDDCEYGAPCVDPKRPYGNSDVTQDMMAIVGSGPKPGEEGWGDWPEDEGAHDAEAERLHFVHLSMQHFLTILSQFGEIPSGSYSRPNTWSKWERAALPALSDEVAL